MNLFVAIFSFFCLYLLHCAEANAATFSSGDQYLQHNHNGQRIEAVSASISKESHSHLEINKWTPWSHLTAESFDLITVPLNYIGSAKIFSAIAAKEFGIRTGLSPPLLQTI